MTGNTKLPSPPIAKLYGEILEEYSEAGGRSPSLSWMGPGARIRNTLIHSPEDIKIPEADSWKYVRAVSVALYDLLARLYPDDTAIAQHAAHLGEVDKVPKWIREQTDPPHLPVYRALMGETIYPGEARLDGSTKGIDFGPAGTRLIIREGPTQNGKVTGQRTVLRIVTATSEKKLDCQRLDIIVWTPDVEKRLVFEPEKPYPYRDFYELFKQHPLKWPSEGLPEEELSAIHASMST